MNLEVFNEKLKRALEKSEGWKVAEGRLTHEESGIYMSTTLIARISKAITVWVPCEDSADIHITNIRADRGPRQCWMKVVRAKGEEAVASTAARKKAFLRGFPGFG